MRGEFSVAASVLAEIKRGTSRDLSEGKGSLSLSWKGEGDLIL